MSVHLRCADCIQSELTDSTVHFSSVYFVRSVHALMLGTGIRVWIPVSRIPEYPFGFL